MTVDLGDTRAYLSTLISPLVKTSLYRMTLIRNHNFPSLFPESVIYHTLATNTLRFYKKKCANPPWVEYAAPISKIYERTSYSH